MVDPVRLERLTDLAAELNAAVRILASVAERLATEVGHLQLDVEREQQARPEPQFTGFQGFGDDDE